MWKRLPSIVADDVIRLPNYRIGSFKRRSSLAEQTLSQAGVVPKRTRNVATLLSQVSHLVKMQAYSIASKRDQITIKAKIAAHEYPRGTEFRDELSKTIAGEIRRMELQDQAERETESDSEPVSVRNGVANTR